MNPWNKNALNSRRIRVISKRKIVVLRFFKRRRKTTALDSPSTLAAQNIELESSLEVERKQHPESTIVVMEANCCIEESLVEDRRAHKGEVSTLKERV